MVAMGDPRGFESFRFEALLKGEGGGPFGEFPCDKSGVYAYPNAYPNANQHALSNDYPYYQSCFSIEPPGHGDPFYLGASDENVDNGASGLDGGEGEFPSKDAGEFNASESDIPYDQCLQILNEEIDSTRAAELQRLYLETPDIEILGPPEETNHAHSMSSLGHQEQEHGRIVFGGEASHNELEQPALSDGASSVSVIQSQELIDYDRPSVSNGAVLASDCLSAVSRTMDHMDMQQNSYSDGEVALGNNIAASENIIFKDFNEGSRAQFIEIVSSDSDSGSDLEDGNDIIDYVDSETSSHKADRKRILPSWALPQKKKERPQMPYASSMPRLIGAAQPGKIIPSSQQKFITEESKLPAGSGGLFFSQQNSLHSNDSLRRVLPLTLAPQTTIRGYGGALQPSVRLSNNINGASPHLPNQDDATTLRTMLQEMASDGKEEASVPKDLMTVLLLKHQRIALAWMEKRERRVECAGGILADDQGLGKTVSTIALLLKARAPVERGDSSSQQQLVEYKASTVELVDEDGEDEVKCLALIPVDPENIKSSFAVAPPVMNTVGKLKHSEKRGTDNNNLSQKGRRAAGTLIVCPTSVLRQWDNEIRDKVTEAAALSVLIYHGPGRTKDPNEVAKYDVVLTTYAIVAMEVPKQPFPDEKTEEKRNPDDYGLDYFGNSSKFPKRPSDLRTLKKSNQHGKNAEHVNKIRNVEEDSDLLPTTGMGPLAKVTWFRVVLDEAQSIKNFRTKVARACWSLRAKKRWCLSGTPIQNTIDDLYSYFRFLRYDPLDQYKSFRSQIKDPISRNPGIGYKKLQLILQTLMLRRTKETMLDGEPIVTLPPRIVSLKQIDFTNEERDFYNKLEMESRQKFQVYAAEGSLQKNYVNILWMLLRLRQACDHPLLVKKPKSELLQTAVFGSTVHLTAEKRDKLRSLLEGSSMICPICMDLPEEPVVSTCCHVFCRQCISEKLTNEYEISCPHLGCRVSVNISSLYSLASLQDHAVSECSSWAAAGGPCLDSSRESSTWSTSSKIDAVLQTLSELPLAENCASDVTDVTADHKEVAPTLAACGPGGSIESAPKNERQIVPATEKAIIFSQWTSMLDLLEEPLKRAGISFRRLDGTMTIAERDRAIFEFSTLPEVTVMIMSLKAASLGLNMVAACHVLLLDIWWNPTTEDQAIDRAHRIGQTRAVRVSRFTIKGTIEDRILALQERKKQMVASAFGENDGANQKTRLTVEDLRYLFSI